MFDLCGYSKLHSKTETITTEGKKSQFVGNMDRKLNVADECCAFYPPTCFRLVLSYVVNLLLNIEFSKLPYYGQLKLTCSIFSSHSRSTSSQCTPVPCKYFFAKKKKKNPHCRHGP